VRSGSRLKAGMTKNKVGMTKNKAGMTEKQGRDDQDDD
jgi:hypothetical protein